MTVLTERAIAQRVAEEAELIAQRCKKYVEILSTSKTETEIIHRIEAEGLPALDDNCMYLMVTVSKGTHFDYLGGVV